tara:strand:+ start:939 stop:2084 length:1146 start_codon:yes stop_codon:yes gene_type:complete
MKEFNFENKNIIILLKSFALGGAEKQALFLASYLQKNYNCNVNIYSYIKSNHPELFFKECELLQIKNLHFVQNPLSAAGNFNYIKRRIKILLFGLKLRKHRPDIIIPYLNPPSIIANISYKIAGAKTTFWHHRGPDYYRDDSIEAVAVKKTKKFIANSPDGKAELIDRFNLSKNDSFFLPNFSTVSSINSLKNIPELNRIKGKRIIGMIGHFRQEKLQSILVESFMKLIKENTGIHLVLVGNIDQNKQEKSNFSDVIRIIEENNLEENVTILHNKSAKDVLPYFDFGVLVSKKEGMPNVIMEYMSYNLAVICTNHEGCKSLLGDKYPYLINNSVDELTEKMEFLLNNEKEFNSIGQKNKNRIEKNFSIEKYIENLTTIINS